MSDFKQADERRRAITSADQPDLRSDGAATGDRHAERVRLSDLQTPPEVATEVERWCKKYGCSGKRRRREVEEQMKLDYYFGGQPIYLVASRDGPIVVPITDRYKDTADLRYVLLAADERARACFTVPSRWQDTVSQILS